jgi:flavin reductase (DIM6/NTAB) family NADH-FMN oxidoreductase RutF
LSQRFSSPAANRFDGIEWHAAISGTPLLDGALAHLECSVVRTFEAGDHSILIGEVLRAGYREGRPLVYFDRRYQGLSEPG